MQHLIKVRNHNPYVLAIAAIVFLYIMQFATNYAYTWFYTTFTAMPIC